MVKARRKAQGYVVPCCHAAYGQGWIDTAATIYPDQKARENNFVHIGNCSPGSFDMPCQSTASAAVAPGHQDQVCFVE